MLRAQSIAAILAARGKDTFVTENGLCVIRGPTRTVAVANVDEEEATEILAQNPQFQLCKNYEIPIENVRETCNGLFTTRSTRNSPGLEYYQNGGQRVYIEDADEYQLILPESSAETTPETWISASMTRQHLLKDPIVDYFTVKRATGKRKRSDSMDSTSSVSSADSDSDTKKTGNWLMQRGNEFEADVISVLTDRFPEYIKTVGTGHGDSSSVNLYNATLDEMAKGTPIIYQGVLHDTQLQTIGSPDLLVRTDFLHILVETAPPIEEVDSIFGDYSYCVVDIKWSTLKLRANGVNLLTSGSTPAFKGQCWVYNQALGQMQGIVPRYAYILGRGWTWKRSTQTYRGTNAFAKLGTIDYHTIDAEYATRTPAALKWRRQLQDKVDQFTPADPNTPEMFPNMKSRGFEHATKKQKLAEEIGEITSVWYCGTKDRETAHKKGVYSWRDPRFSSKLLGWKNPLKCEILDSILAVNRGEAHWSLGSNFSLRNPPENVTEVFIDFESLKSTCTETVKINNTVMSPSGELVFMVGVGHVSNGEWVYRGFMAETRSHRAECQMFREVHRYLAEIGPYVAYHWSAAEPRMYAGAIQRSSRLGRYEFNFCDLLEHVRNIPFTVQGALDFSVKSIGRALYQLGHVSTTWAPEDSGMIVMIEAMNAYKTQNPQKALEHVFKYNEVDCKIMWDILRFLREVS